MLRSFPELRILATSRQALGMAGDVRLRVPPLSLLPEAAPLSASQIAGFDAVSLDQHVVLDLRCLDRIYLNASVPALHARTPSVDDHQGPPWRPKEWLRESSDIEREKSERRLGDLLFGGRERRALTR